MIDPTTIRRNAYALAELESTIGCFFGGIMYLSTPGPCELLPQIRAEQGLDMIRGALEWEPSMALVCERPKEAA